MRAAKITIDFKMNEIKYETFRMLPTTIQLPKERK